MARSEAPSLVIIQGECYDPLTNATGLELLISTWARACADQGITTTVLAEGWDNRLYQNTGEPFMRCVATPTTFERTLRELCGQSTVISCHARAQRVPSDIGVPFSIFAHSTHFAFQRWLALSVPGRDHPAYEAQELRHLGAATRWAGPSRYATTTMPFPEATPVDVVPPFADPALVRAPRGPQMNLALYLGRPIERKGLYWLLNNRRQWSFPFTWAGDLSASPEYPSLEKVMKHFPPLAPVRGRAQVYPLLATAPVVLCPYRQEPFGMVIIESLAAGARVVAFDEGGPSEMKGLPGLSLVKTGDIAAFDEAVVAALDNAPLCSTDRQQIADRYSPETSKNSFVQHIRALQECV